MDGRVALDLAKKFLYRGRAMFWSLQANQSVIK